MWSVFREDILKTSIIKATDIGFMFERELSLFKQIRIKNKNTFRKFTK